MSEPGKAVFLSYASQDAEAARRLAEAFRAAGVEVWFDQSELRGGDAWDQKIRRQIRECALFVPVISRHTQEREEGYFRLEWKLAEDRSHLMAKGRPFILPVSVDGTTERGALVPEAFLAVQWTRLLEGEIPAGLVRRVQQLLGEPGTGEPAAPAVAAPARPGAIAPRSGSRAWLIGAVLAFALAAVAYVALRPGVRGPAAAAVEAAGKTPAEARGATDKSIAVLPFANMSEDKDANAFFSDGIHEDILTNLAHIRELRVVSRTSVMEYRGTTKRIPQIARELHVAYVLEGSVRRAGTKIRVTGQLIRADTDEHVWAKSYDRDLTDVFAIQAELAQAIAAELDTALSPREQKLVESRPTENLAAYELLLKARAEHNARQPSNESVRMSFSVRENLLQSAIELDPNFALAWSELATLHVELIAASIDSSSARLAKAKAAVSQVQALAPESPAAIQALGSYLLFGLQEPGQAVEQFRKLVELQPNDSESQVWLAIALMAQGRWLDSIAAGRHSVELDPRNARARQGLITTLLLVRRYAEAK
ncbi:MAG: TIR domain-containing protein, partial [Verrucomicrobia bacterium]|nr:TIR domain-containing protein [Verrucomicrobiota bacterium]